MTTVKQVMESFPNNHILISNDATNCQISSGTMMTSKDMIYILSEAILNRKVDCYETKKFDDGTFTIIHILSEDVSNSEVDRREFKEIDDCTSSVVPMLF